MDHRTILVVCALGRGVLEVRDRSGERTRTRAGLELASD